MPAALELTTVTVRYGDRVAVHAATLAVRRGEVVGLLGPNGSGKSSLIAVAAGLLDPVGGTVTVEGVSRAADPAGFARRVGLVPQDAAVYDELSAKQNLEFFGRLYGLRGPDLAARVSRGLARACLTDRTWDRAGTFSGGMKQRLGVAAALLHDPPVLLLDEPTAALDPAARVDFLELVQRLKDDGHAVLLTTHHEDDAAAGCDRVARMRGGVLTVDEPAGGGPAVLYGHVRQRPPAYLMRALRERLGPAVDLELTGRRLRLSAATPATLGAALAAVLADGVALETFRTPPRGAGMGEAHPLQRVGFRDV